MRKTITAMTVIAGMVLSAIPAEAQYHNRRPVYRSAPHYHAVPRYQPRYYTQPRYVHPRHNWVPYVIGGLALGAVVGGLFYNQYGEVCHREVINYDYSGRPLTGIVCE